MNEDVMNMSVRKFLKKGGVTSQREIESAIRAAQDKGGLPDSLDATMMLTVNGIDLSVTIDGKIDLV